MCKISGHMLELLWGYLLGEMWGRYRGDIGVGYLLGEPAAFIYD